MGMDKLEHIFEMQKALDTEIIKKRSLSGYSSSEWIQKDVLAIVSELGELLDEVNFKWWKNAKEIHTPSLHEELVDVLHFFVSMCLHAGLTPEEMYRIYLDKNEENFNRQRGLSQKSGYAVEEQLRNGESKV